LALLLRLTTGVHIVKGEYPVGPGLTLGHESVGVIDGHPATVAPGAGA